MSHNEAISNFAARAAATPHSARHLNQIELSRRWGFSPRTLEGWRWFGKGPAFIKAGGKVLYRLEDIEAFEAEQLRQRTPRRRKSSSSSVGAKDTRDAKLFT
jgi:hypothetical protein